MTRSTVYGTPHRRPHPLVLVALAVLAVGVLTGIGLALQAIDDDAPVSSTSYAASSSPPAPPPPVSSPAAPSSAPPSSRAPSQPPQPLQFVGVRGQQSQLCLDLQPEQPGAGGLLVLAPCAPGAANQRWQLTPTGMLVNGATGLCVTVANADPNDNARVQQEGCGDAPHQRWVMFLDVDGSATFTVQHSGRCLDVANGATNPGAPVHQYGCHGGANQRWLLQTG